MDADRKAYNHQRHSMAVMAALSQESGGSLEADIAAAETIRAAACVSAPSPKWCA